MWCHVTFSDEIWSDSWHLYYWVFHLITPDLVWKKVSGNLTYTTLCLYPCLMEPGLVTQSIPRLLHHPFSATNHVLIRNMRLFCVLLLQDCLYKNTAAMKKCVHWGSTCVMFALHVLLYYGEIVPSVLELLLCLACVLLFVRPPCRTLSCTLYPTSVLTRERGLSIRECITTTVVPKF